MNLRLDSFWVRKLNISAVFDLFVCILGILFCLPSLPGSFCIACMCILNCDCWVLLVNYFRVFGFANGLDSRNALDYV